MERTVQAGQPPRRPELSASKRELMEKRLRGALRSAPAASRISKRHPHAGPAPLSSIQQQLWFIHELEPANPAYHIPAASRLNGHLDVQALEHAINAVIERHEALRTIFPSADRGPIQVVEPFQPRPLPVIDFQEYAWSERNAQADAFLRHEAHRPFDLARGPLFRASLVRLSGSEHILVFVMHHIISDGWSLGVLFRDLEAYYRSHMAGVPAALPELPLQFSDFSAWQVQLQESGALANDIQFWKDKLANAPFAIDVPLDRPRSENPATRGGSSALILPRSFGDAMLALSHVHGATSFMFLSAALALLLNKWAAQPDLVLGTVVASRTRREIENLVGCFMNFLPLRTRLDEVQTGLDLLRHIKATVLEAYAHQDCPFEKIVEALNPSRTLTRNPLYNVALLLQNFPVGVLKDTGLSSSFIPITTDAALLDLRFVAEETETGILIHCEYDADLFEAQTIHHLLASYRLVLETLVANPEVPLADVRITPELSEQAAAVRKRQAKHTIAVAGTFTVEPIEESLNFWMSELDLPAQVRFAPYNQVFQQLLDPGSLFRTNQQGVNLILLRLEDLTRGEQSRNVDELLRALKSALPQISVPTLICVCPPSRAALADLANVECFSAFEKRMRDELSGLGHAYLFTSAGILDLYPVSDYDDPHAEQLGHVPYSPAFFHALGTFVARRFHALIRPPRKVIVLDCDQTLWSGICGEDGPSGIRCDAPRKALQEFMRAQHDAGMLLAVCSKNDEADVAEVFNACRDMVLHKPHFAAWRVNWQAKSANIRSLATELNLGLDSFIFVDDNPVECAEVEANCPSVLTLQVPADPAQIPHWLKHLWVFDRVKVTAEDRSRTAMYQQNRLRDELLAESVSMADFIASLDLKITIEPARADQLPRLAQLTERTNQFNCTTVRRTEAELAQMWRTATHQLLAVTVSDRFGDYGLVGLAIYKTAGEALVADTFLLSCRVLGKGVEHRLLAHLGAVAHSAGAARVDVPFRPTTKNKPALDFLEKVGAAFRQPLGPGSVFHFPADVASETVFDPEAAKTQKVEAAKPPAASAGEGRPGARFRRFTWIAQQANDPPQIAQLISEKRKPVRAGASGVAREPQTELERALLQVWREALRNEVMGVTDEFFAMGGTSLLAVRLCAQIEKTLGHKVPLATLFRAPTVEQLARAIERSHSRHTRSCLVPIQQKGTRPPLVLVHGAGGGILWGYANLAALLGEDQPVYAFEPRPTKATQLVTVQDMAAQYIQDLRAFQRIGPYYLGGYCFGGYVAYEMARQLEREGEEVRLVLLLDSAAPNGSYSQIPWWRPAYYPKFALNFAYWLWDFVRLDAAERNDFVKRKLVSFGRFLLGKRPPAQQRGIALEDYIDVRNFPEHELELWKAHLGAGARYCPQPYGGKAVLLRTRGQPVLCSLDSKYGWGELARGGVEVHLVSGAHERIFIQPDIQVLAHQLRSVLTAAQAGSAPFSPGQRKGENSVNLDPVEVRT